MSEALGLHFTVDEYRNRIAGVQAEMARRGIDVLMVNHLENIYYLSGFRTIGYYSFMALFVPASGQPVHFDAPDRADDAAGNVLDRRPRALSRHRELHATRRSASSRTAGGPRSRIGIDKSAWYLTIDDYEKLVAALPNATMVDGSMIVENLRLIKSPAEQAYSRQAGKAASEGMRSAIGALRAGITEDDLMAAAYQGLFEMHSEYPGLPPLINAGVRHTMAHAMAEGHPVNNGDAVYFEVGARIKRYHAATLRIGYVGHATEAVLRPHRSVPALDRRRPEAQMKPGNPAEAVDKAARKVIADAGYGDKFRHKAGYSIGIALPPDWSEARTMMLRGRRDAAAAAGDGVPLPAGRVRVREYGVGLSETVLITETGHEILTDVEQKLFVVKPISQSEVWTVEWHSSCCGWPRLRSRWRCPSASGRRHSRSVDGLIAAVRPGIADAVRRGEPVPELAGRRVAATIDARGKLGHAGLRQCALSLARRAAEGLLRNHPARAVGAQRAAAELPEAQHGRDPRAHLARRHRVPALRHHHGPGSGNGLPVRRGASRYDPAGL